MVFVVEVAVYIDLRTEERQERIVRGAGEWPGFRPVVGLRLRRSIAALLLGCLLVAGSTGSDKVSEAATAKL